jgi:ABC-2 type transport system ATP-binding protein
MSIKVEHISKTYGTQQAVDSISFEVMPGEVVGFLGPNGAGKSTTLKMITGYLPKDTGNIFVCGIPVEGEAIPTKKKIGYLAESNPLYHEMYVREYLQFIGELHRVRNVKSRVDEVVGMTGLSAEMHKEIGQLSKGYKQRVGLAAALIHDPEVLILDEPTTGLDPNQIIEIREVIRSLGKKKTILFSSHILQEVESLCDRVIVINKGKIVADDRIEKLRDAGAASSLRVQLKEKAIKNIFENIPGLLNIEQVDEHNWVFQTSDAEKLSKELLGFTLQHSLNIVSLQTQTRSLEDIFRELTGEMN